VIYVILGRFSKATADNFALPPDAPEKQSAVQRESEIRDVVEHPNITGTLAAPVVWTLGEYDVVITIDVPSPEKGGAAALALATRVGISTTTLTGFKADSLQDVMDDAAGYGSH
jgi:uncharacterized protein with GYD domain